MFKRISRKSHFPSLPSVFSYNLRTFKPQETFIEDAQALPSHNIRSPRFYNTPFLLFPIKTPLFPQNSYFTKLHPVMNSLITSSKLKYLVAFFLKPDGKFESVPINIKDFPSMQEFIASKDPKSMNDPLSSSSAAPNDPNLEGANSTALIEKELFEDYHQNIVYDDSIVGMEKDAEDTLVKLDSLNDVHTIGTLCKLTVQPNPEKPGESVMMFKSINRVKIVKEIPYKAFDGHLREFIDYFKFVQVAPLQDLEEPITSNYKAKLSMLLGLYANLRTKIPINVPELIYQPTDPRTLDVLSGFLCLTTFFQRTELQKLLEILSVSQRLDILHELFSKYETKLTSEWAELDKVTQGLNKPNTKEKMLEIYDFLKKAKESPLKSPLIEKLAKQLAERNFPPHIKTLIEEEISQMQELNEQHPDFNNKRNLLELVLALPFGIATADSFDLENASRILNEDHFGMDDVKERILEFMAVSKLRGTTGGKSILLVGPPGVGKTSIASSIARCMGRKFARIALGGEYDVAVIKGHRKTYLGSYPGKIVQALKTVQSENPVILLDEVDKIGRSLRGNIQDALLEVLDPVQNNKFYDNYLEVPIDLSKVLFVCSANLLETVHPALLDRMEVIHVSGYTQQEKFHIVEKHLLPKALKSVGLNEDQLKFSEEAIEKLINGYARESGLRNLERYIIRILEKTSLKIVMGQNFDKVFRGDQLKDFIGLPIFGEKKLYKDASAGIVVGLAYNSYGGSIIFIETLKQNYDEEDGKKNRRGSIKYTGSLGDVMQESIQIAYTYAREFCIILYGNSFLESNDIHVHFPEGASKKDGPSAGIAICSSLISLALNMPIEQHVAMTGEISLQGKVLKIGGVKEKLLAAKREGIKTVIFPRENHADVDELKAYIKQDMNILFAETYWDVAKIIFPKLFEAGKEKPAALGVN